MSPPRVKGIVGMKKVKSGLMIKIVIAAIVIFAGVSIISLRSQISDAKKQQAQLQTQVDEALQENNELEYAIDHAGDNETIEDVARGKVGLVEPGEKIFYDVGN